MTEKTTTLASFNVDAKEWKKFKDLARKEDRTASYCLNELIRLAVERQSIFPIDTDTQSISDIDLSGFVGRDDFETAIASCNERFGYLESVVEQMKNSPEPGLSKDIEPVAVNVPDAPLNTDDGMMKTVIPSFMLDDHQVDPKHLKSRLEDIKGTSLKPLTWQSQYLKECLDEWKQYELWKHFQSSWDMFCEIELGKPSEWIDLFIEGAQDIDPNEIRQSMMDILQSINNSEYTEPVAVDNSMVNPVSTVTAAVTPETVEPTETPQTLAPIEVGPETTNDTEPEPVKVEPVAVGHEYDPKKGFSHKEMSDVSGNKIGTIRVAASKRETKHGIDGHDYKYDKTERAWFRLDDCPEQPETNQPIESSPTVEAVEAEPEKK